MLSGAGLVSAFGVGLAATALGVGLVAVADSSPSAGSTTATTRLFDDAGGVAMFDGRVPMRGGETRVACIAVGAVGPSAGDEVYLLAENVRGALAPELTVVVEKGAGGRAGDCAGFTGVRVWQGTLPELAAPRGPEGLPLDWQPAVTAQHTFRVSVTLSGSAAAAGQQAHADLVWRMTFSDVVAREPGAAPGPAPGSDRGGAAVGPDLTLGGSPLIAAVTVQARRALAAAVGVLRSPQYPLAAFLIIAAFLLVQDRLDRRDPKLMLAARNQRETERTFPDPFRPARERRWAG